MIRYIVILFLLFGSCMFKATILCAQDAVNILANAIKYKENGTVLIATGNVIIFSESYQLNATQIIYNKKTDKISATGPIYLKTGSGVQIISEVSELSGDLKKSLSNGVQALINDRFQIASESVEKNRNGNITFYKTVGSSCEICQTKPIPFWQIKASKIEHKGSLKQLEFHKAWLEIIGITLIYTPYLRTPEPGVSRSS